MAESYNVYLDESCHLEHDGQPSMVLGAVWCPVDRVREVSRRVQQIKGDHGFPPTFEIKWTKVSPSELGFYRTITDYFLDDDDLHFRGVVIPDKSLLNHEVFDQIHDDWYYKMCFTLIEPIIDPRSAYFIYLDIKDTRSERKRGKLEKVLRIHRGDANKGIIKRVQQIRSHESPIMQITDLLIGAVSYRARRYNSSDAKLHLVERIENRLRKRLDESTWLGEPKFNVLRWRAREATNE